ncbi:MAG TPA: response regulator [Myxococcaceae bacterium]|jgi:DNA-binding response OmpR family regulator
MKVLLVEDDPSLREGMEEVISEFVQVRPVGSVDSALAALREERFDLVMADLRIAGAAVGGRTILEAARRLLQPVAIVSAAEPEEIRRALQPLEADAILGKPFQLEEMTELVKRFLTLRNELERLSSQRPPEAGWAQAAEGMQVARVTSRQQEASWVRLQAGASGTWPVLEPQVGCLLIEGEFELAGERQKAPRYFFLSGSQPREARTEKGCLVVTLALRD